MNPKEVAGTWAANQVTNGMKVGLGTGSTAFFAIRRLGERVAEGLSIRATATSRATEQLAEQWQIPLEPLASIGTLDLTIDGADEVTPELHLIKGGGGALFREKMVALNSQHLLIVADPSKEVEVLGAFPLPVEVVPFAHEITASRLEDFGMSPKPRLAKDGSLYLTDNGNFLYDCYVSVIPDPVLLHRTLKGLIGVVETGLFLGMASSAVIGLEDGTVKILSGESPRFG